MTGGRTGCQSVTVPDSYAVFVINNAKVLSLFDPGMKALQVLPSRIIQLGSWVEDCDVTLAGSLTAIDLIIQTWRFDTKHCQMGY